MRPRFDIRGSKNNEILSSLPRWQHAERLKEEKKLRMEIRDNQKHAWDLPNADEYNDPDQTKDHEIAGVVELGVLKDGRVDQTLNGPVVIGGREHNMENGRMRIISKQTVDESLIPIWQEREFKDSIMSAVLSDRSGRICRMMLPADRYKMLIGGNDTIKDIAPKIPRDVMAQDARPEYFTMFHESSKEWALAVHKLSIVIDRTSIVYDGDISDWLSKYSSLKSTAPGS